MPGLKGQVHGPDGRVLYMSLRRYEQTYRVSRDAARAAVRRGDIVMTEYEGHRVVDVEATIRRPWHMERVSFGRVAGSGGGDGDDLADEIERMVSSNDVDQVKAAGELVRVRSALLKYRRELGEVVEKSLVEGLVFELARRERDSWLGWVDRAAAVVSAEFSLPLDDVLRVLERLVRDHLGSLSDVELRFS